MHLLILQFYNISFICKKFSANLQNRNIFPVRQKPNCRIARKILPSSLFLRIFLQLFDYIEILWKTTKTFLRFWAKFLFLKQ